MEAVVEAGDPNPLVPGGQITAYSSSGQKTAQRRMMAALQVTLDKSAVE